VVAKAQFIRFIQWSGRDYRLTGIDASKKITQEVKVDKKSFVPAAILVAVLSFIGSSAIALNGSNGGYFQCRYAWGIFNMAMGIPIRSVLLPLMAFIPTMLCLKISRKNLTTLYVIGMVVSMYGICDYEDFAEEMNN
jgi:hypothetical protein